jgi:hypothetical protein
MSYIEEILAEIKSESADIQPANVISTTRTSIIDEILNELRPAEKPKSFGVTRSWEPENQLVRKAKGVASGAFSLITGLREAAKAASVYGGKVASLAEKATKAAMPESERQKLDILEKSAEAENAKLDQKSDWGLLGKAVAPKVRELEKTLRIENPTVADKVANVIGSGGAFIVAGLGPFAIAKFAGLAPKVAAVFGTSVSAVTEAAVNAGADFDTLKSEGKSDDEAAKAAGKTFLMGRKWKRSLMLRLKNYFKVRGNRLSAM